MQMVKKILLILVAAWVAFILFMPKQNLYFKLEERLDKEDIHINETHIKEGLFNLKIDDASIYIKGINLIQIKNLTFFSLLFYSQVQLEEIQVDQSLSSMLPHKIKNILLTYTVVSPQHLSLSGEGTFGSFKGEINLVKHTIHLDFTELNSAETFKRYLKKGEEGWYYETTF